VDYRDITVIYIMSTERLLALCDSRTGYAYVQLGENL